MTKSKINKIILITFLQGKKLGKGVILVNYADIIWNLVEKLLDEKEKQEKETEDQIRNEQD